MKKVNQFLGLSVVCIMVGGLGLSTVAAQGNPIPLNWRNLTVQVIETYGNNNTKPLQGAKVTVELKDPDKADDLQRKYPTLRLPVTRTAQTRGALFGKLPPSKDVGPYIVTVIPKPNDRNNQYICEEKTNRDSREVRMGGGSDQRLTYNYTCQKADAVNEFNRRKKGGYDLTVKVEQDAAPRGYGLWVHVYDKNGNRIKKVRTGGTAEAKFRAIDPGYNPYKVQVYALNKLLFEDHYDMPNQNATYTADIDAGGGNGNSGNGGGSYKLTVKLDLWAYLYDKKGKQVQKERVGSSGAATFHDVNPKYGPYKIEVYSAKKLLYKGKYEMPARSSTYTVK